MMGEMVIVEVIGLPFFAVDGFLKLRYEKKGM